MNIQRQAFQEWYIANHHDGDIHPNQQLLEWSEKGGFYFASSVEDLWEAWQAAKAQAVPNAQQALHDRLLVKLIREHVERHISEISVNDLFDKGWLAAMKCIQNNIEMLEAQEQAND